MSEAQAGAGDSCRSRAKTRKILSRRTDDLGSGDMAELIIMLGGPGVQQRDGRTGRREAMVIGIYSFLLTLALGVSAPWWLWRMATGGRYREGLRERMGLVPGRVREAVSGKKLVWVHAVSVGEVLAIERLVRELQRELGADWVVAVSTTTATGQKIARERVVGGPVFYFPLDFAFAVRAWLRMLRPALMVLVESELWPRHLIECERAGVPVAVVNARVSDRSFPRYLRLRWAWNRLFGKVRVFLAQGEESAERLREIGAERVRVTGNLKYDAAQVKENAIARRIKAAAGTRPVIVAGSTADGGQMHMLNEEEMVIQAWEGRLRVEFGALLVLAPRHPERFREVESVAAEFSLRRASELKRAGDGNAAEIVLLDTIGDLAAVYDSADVAFVGGSLVRKGGQNPLEAARFGVPVVMGPSYENFREMVDAMRAAQAIRVTDREGLEAALTDELQNGRAMGERGRRFFEQQNGATQRTIDVLLELIRA